MIVEETPRPLATGALRDDVLMEWYRYPPGPRIVLPRHAHAEYQFNLNLGTPGGVRYRGTNHVVPARRLTVIMPDEPHRPQDPDDRDATSAHMTVYASTDMIGDIATASSGNHRHGTPYFRELIFDDAELIDRFVQLHALSAIPSSTLEHDDCLFDVLAGLIERHADIVPTDSTPAAHRAVRRARDHLHDNPTSDVSLAELSSISGLSPYHLSRLFRAHVGVPPHAYQIHLRIEHAKRLLLTGTPVSRAGADSGFFDLSHFTRHFRRYVGAPPGAYARHARSSGTAAGTTLGRPA